MNLAPIVLFVYNRPWHTEQTLNALMQNELAGQSVLYVYSDGPKENATEVDLQKIRETRAILLRKQWCKEVIIVTAESNKGLSASVIEGTTEIVEKYGKVITIEDDVIVTNFFLEFMNKALDLYKNNDKVWMISGFYWPVKTSYEKNGCFFLPVLTTQAWGTWKRSWRQFDIHATGYEKLKISRRLRKRFNLNGSYDFTGMLIMQMESNQIDSWAIRFWWSMFKKNGVNLFPDKSLIKNIGYDGSGVHCSSTSQYYDEKWDENYVVSHFPKQIQVSNKNYRAVKVFHQELKKVSNGKVSIKVLIAHKIQKTKRIALKLKSLLKPVSIYFRKFSKIKNRSAEALIISDDELLRLQNTKRFTQTETKMLGHKIIVPDSATFLGSLNEIFIEEIYKFNLKNNSEINMIDCGANIGLATIYLKKRFPFAHIAAIEADPNIFNAMQSNFSSFGFLDVNAINAAVSDNDGTINFHLEGGHSGMICNDASETNITKVKSIRLKSFLQKYQHISFLKIDIEGHETKVLPDIAEELKKVEFLFLEYHSFIGQEQELDTILKIIKEARFKYYIKEATQKKDPFITKEIFLGMDLLVNIFCYHD